jgi:type VI secretion system protein ImpH
MATATWRKLPAIVKSIIQEGPKYNFLQLMRLLDNCEFAKHLASNLFNKYIQLNSTTEISFPASDIQKCTIDTHNRLKLQLTFMGLCGVDSPLPHYFLAHHNNCIYDFLNIFNNRLYLLFYLAWKKYHPFIQLNNSPYRQYLKFLSGNLLTELDQKEFAFTGLLGQRIHNSLALSGLISEYLNGLNAQVAQFIPSWAKLETTWQFGHAIYLGDNSLLGNQIITRTRKIAIQIGPLDSAKAQQLFPGQIKYQHLRSLITCYLGHGILFDLILIINQSIIDCLKLGNHIQLGWTCWLGKLHKTNYQLKF